MNTQQQIENKKTKQLDIKHALAASVHDALKLVKESTANNFKIVRQYN
jgi:hypothetical protein